LHHSPPLEIDWALAKSAQAYAEQLARTNSFAHSTSNGQYGENLASSFNSRQGYVFSGDEATQNWYDEIKDYKFNEESQRLEKIGHFSQVVWKKTVTAGFGRAKSATGNFIVVGQYKPPGNFMGQFKENVLSPSGPPPKLETAPESKSPSPSKDSKVIKQSKTPITKTFSPKSKDDKMIKKATKTITENGKVRTEIIETYITPDGKTYEVTK